MSFVISPLMSAISNDKIISAYTLYVHEGKTITAIARELGSSFQTIRALINAGGWDEKRRNYLAQVMEEADSHYMRLVADNRRKFATAILEPAGTLLDEVKERLKEHSSLESWELKQLAVTLRTVQSTVSHPLGLNAKEVSASSGIEATAPSLFKATPKLLKDVSSEVEVMPTPKPESKPKPPPPAPKRQEKTASAELPF